MVSLSGATYPKEILQLSWQDWTPKIAEWARQHFLGPFSSNPHWKELSLELIARGIVTVRTLTAEEEQVRQAALRYCEKVKQDQRPKPKAPSWLAGKGYPPEILKLTWREWTPETAELVREHFLWPLRENPRWKAKGLLGVVWNIGSLRGLTEEEEYLVTQAVRYTESLGPIPIPSIFSTARDEETPPSTEPPSSAPA